MPKQTSDYKLCIAPMMDWTDRHCRYFLRLITPHARLYTEMVTTGALIHGDKDRHLNFNEEEHPIALQLGGSDPTALAISAKWGENYGYDEINLNCGCPSDRVQNGMFGACLMKQPALVADCISAMREAVDIPITIKCRIGIDEQDSYGFLTDFVGKTTEAGCTAIILHARKAWLKGLSPKQNRDIPPLKYNTAHRLKKDFANLPIILNGGLTTAEQALPHLKNGLDGVMIGRAAYKTPWCLAEFDQKIYKKSVPATPEEVIENFIIYAEKQLTKGVPLKSMTRHILGLFQGQAGAKHWRRTLSTEAFKKDAGTEVIKKALSSFSAIKERGNNTA